MSVEIETKTITKSICPHCNAADSTVDHLLDQTTRTAWFCDNCGGRYSLNFKDGACEILPLKEWRIDIAVVLRYENAIVVVKGMVFAKGDKSNYDSSGNEYFYGEHTCPTNWMGVECLYNTETKDPDPHGMFSYIGFELYPEGGEDCNYDWEPLINRVIKSNKIENEWQGIGDRYD